MKRIVSIFVSALLAFASVPAQGQSSDAFEQWCGNKYSMFIHFGLYSHLGGVWDGEPVTQGYSEQIQSFAGIFSDWYAATAEEFDPENFDAAEIVSLAKAAGMRSVIFTSKHHDGFCMFRTATTDYNSVDMTPSGRDYVRELSDACAEAGMNFGLYFSLIDWNYPHAYPISSHNADFVTPEHHEFNKEQVRELLTMYGPISELWFDMGSLQPRQSRELYDLVKEIQPDCMVSGRLGNDFYDFAVMADNKLPESALYAPWQSAASMFPETWSYRSWQERGEVEDKVAEKLRSLIRVVSHGGNYLLNIGPDAKGDVVPFERDVLLSIGKWLERNGDAVYGTEQSPFDTEFEWGDVTMKGDSLYLLLTGTYPENGEIILKADKTGSKVKVTRKMFSDPAEVHVIRLHWPAASSRNMTPDYSYSCFDYYSNYRSTVAYNYRLHPDKEMQGLELDYTASDCGKTVLIQVGEKKLETILDLDNPKHLNSNVKVVASRWGQMRGGTFDRAVSLDGVQWNDCHDGYARFESHPFSNYLMVVDVEAKKACQAVFSIIAGNGVEVLAYDIASDTCVSVFKHLNPYRTVALAEDVLLDLKKGKNTFILRSYNRFENEVLMGFAPSQEQTIYVQNILLNEPIPSGVVPVRISNMDNESQHTDCKLHNVRIKLITK